MPTSFIDLLLSAFLLILYVLHRAKSISFFLKYFLPSFFWFLTCYLLQTFRYNGGDLNTYFLTEFPSLLAVWNFSNSFLGGTILFSLIIFLLYFELKQFFYFAILQQKTLISSYKNQIQTHHISQPSNFLLYYIFFLSPSLNLFINFSGKDNILAVLILFSSLCVVIGFHGSSVSKSFNAQLAVFIYKYSFLLFSISFFFIVTIRFYYCFYVLLLLFYRQGPRTFTISKKIVYILPLFLFGVFVFVSYIITNSNFLFYLDNVDTIMSVSEGSDFTSAGNSSLSLSAFPFPFSLLQAFRPILLLDPFSHVLILSIDFSVVLSLISVTILQSSLRSKLWFILISGFFTIIPLALLSVNPNVADNTRKLPTLFLYIVPLLLYFYLDKLRHLKTLKITLIK